MAGPPTNHPVPSTIPDYELDKSHPLTPTNALIIHLAPALNAHGPSKIEDLTPRLHSLFSPTSGITDDARLSAYEVSSLSPPPPVKYMIEKRNPLGTHMAILDGGGHEVGEWKLPVLKHDGGEGQFLFPSSVPGVDAVVKETVELKDVESKANSGEATIRDVHHDRQGKEKKKIEAFIRNGMMHLWEVDADRQGEGDHQRSLFKVRYIYLTPISPCFRLEGIRFIDAM